MNDKKSWIPESWTFADTKVAENFDAHVREQLPWYDLVTESVAHFGRHYIPTNGIVYDIGASTGNIARCLESTVRNREASLTSIEKEAEMASLYHGPGTIVVADALSYAYQPFNFAVCFLVLMFMPPGERLTWLRGLTQKIKPGGALVVVDKINTPPGYVGTALRRLTMDWKLRSGTPPEDILRKELSLAGYQRPLNELDFSVIFPPTRKFFQMGEFCGWILEREE